MLFGPLPSGAVIPTPVPFISEVTDVLPFVRSPSWAHLAALLSNCSLVEEEVLSEHTPYLQQRDQKFFSCFHVVCGCVWTGRVKGSASLPLVRESLLCSTVSVSLAVPAPYICRVLLGTF